MNYGNRNASSPNTVNDMLLGYSAAVSSSIGVSLGLKALSANFTRHLRGGTALLMHSMITYIAVATAGFLNSYCMRMSEMQKGIKIFDKSGEEMGISQITAKKAVIETASSRIVLAFPIFTIPGVGMFLLDKMHLMPKNFALKTITELTVVAFALWVALPISVSLFPQQGDIEASALEQ